MLQLSSFYVMGVATAAGLTHSLALKADGIVRCWGAETPSHVQMVTVARGLSNVIAIAAGGDNSFALRSNGHVVVWGDNSYVATNISPVLTKAIAVTAGIHYRFANMPRPHGFRG